MKITMRFTGILMLSVVLCAACNIAEAGIIYSFTTIEGPTPGLGGEFTNVQAISDTHLVVGYSYPNDSCTYSFLYDAGALSLITAPSTFPRVCLRAEGVNDRGEIVGTYGDIVQALGFLINDGAFTTIDAQSTVQSSPYKLPFTLPQGISNRGLIAGIYEDTTGNHGFVYSGGAFRFFDVPGALDTYAQGINDLGHVAGYYFDGSGYHGFLKTLGKINSIDVPGAVNTYARGINDFDTIVGYADDATGQHGFIHDRAGFTPFDFPGGTQTQPTGINRRGQIVGSAFNTPASPQLRGFLATPVSFMEVMPQIPGDTIKLGQPLITVAIFSARNFNAPAVVNTASLTFGRTGTEQSLAACTVVAHNPNDNVPNDLVCTFSTSASAFQCGDTTAILTGQLFDGTPIRGFDKVHIAPCNH